MSWIRAIRRFFNWALFKLSVPFRAVLAKKNPLQDKRPGVIRTILFPLLWLLSVLFMVVANLVELVVAWSSSRQTRAILLAMPSLIAFAMFAFVMIYLLNTKSGALVNSYLLRATQAENVESYDTARMYYEKLLQLDQSNQSYEFLIARTYDSEGKLEKATRRMSKLLTQPDVAGVVNFWFAQKMLEREDLLEDQRWQLCLEYLDEFLSEAPDHKEANVLALEANSVLSKMYVSRNLFEDGLDYLLRAEQHAITLTRVSERSYLALARIQRKIAILYRQKEDRSLEKSYDADSLQSIVRAISYFRKKHEESPKSIEYLLLLSDSYLFRKDFEAAIRQIDVALRNDIHQRIVIQLREAKSRILAAWAGDAKIRGDLTTCIEKVDQALFLDPKNASALAFLAEISVLNIDEVSLLAKQKLEAAIGDSAAPFSVHMILGSYAAAQKNDELALKHLRQANLLNRRSTAVMNNLAFVLARGQRFEEALSLINVAIKMSPNSPRFLDTRGNIFLKQKQYELAFHDFEAAELKIKNNESLYRNLLFLVQELGFDDLYRKKYQKRLDVLMARKETGK